MRRSRRLAPSAASAAPSPLGPADVVNRGRQVRAPAAKPAPRRRSSGRKRATPSPRRRASAAPRAATTTETDASAFDLSLDDDDDDNRNAAAAAAAMPAPPEAAKRGGRRRSSTKPPGASRKSRGRGTAAATPVRGQRAAAAPTPATGGRRRAVAADDAPASTPALRAASRSRTPLTPAVLPADASAQLSSIKRSGGGRSVSFALSPWQSPSAVTTPALGAGAGAGAGAGVSGSASRRRSSARDVRAAEPPTPPAGGDAFDLNLSGDEAPVTTPSSAPAGPVARQPKGRRSSGTGRRGRGSRKASTRAAAAARVDDGDDGAPPSPLSALDTPSPGLSTRWDVDAVASDTESDAFDTGGGGGVLPARRYVPSPVPMPSLLDASLEFVASEDDTDDDRKLNASGRRSSVPKRGRKSSTRARRSSASRRSSAAKAKRVRVPRPSQPGIESWTEDPWAAHLKERFAAVDNYQLEVE